MNSPGQAARDKADELLAAGSHAEVFAHAELWAERGEAWAQGLLGTCYMCGIGAEVDMTEAEHWLVLASNAGDKIAQHNLETMYAVTSRGPGKTA